MTLLEHLRQASRQDHHELDHHPLLAPLVRDDLDRTAYVRALAALSGAQAAAEGAAAAALPRLAPDYPWRSRLAALRADLAELGGGETIWRGDIPAPDSPGQLLGLLYVLEGSRLGARVIARQLARHLADAPNRYFAGETVDWERFRTWAESLDPQLPDQAAAAARAWFDLYRRHLDACLEQQSR